MFGPLKHISPRTRILFFATFLVLLPGAILSYMGFRSIKEKAENLATTYRGTVNLVRDRIETEVLGLEKPLSASIGKHPLRSDSPEEIKAWIRQLGLTNPGLGHLFLVSTEGGVSTASLSLGWVKNENEPELAEIARSAVFRSAEESEFVRKDPAGAVGLYRTILADSRTPAGRKFLLSRVGRCFFKMRSYNQGIAEYRKMLLPVNQERGSAAAPPAVTALSQIAEGYALVRNEKERQKTVLTLYERLLMNPWDLKGGDYTFYLESAIRDVDSLLKTSPNEVQTPQGISRWKDREKTVLEECEFIQRTHQVIVPQILAEMDRGTSSESMPSRFSLPFDGPTIEVNCVQLPAAFQELGIAAIGYANNDAYFVSTLLPRVLNTVDLGKDLVVGILDPSGNPRYFQSDVPTARYLVAENFSKRYPAWKVALFHPEGKTIDELVGRDQNTYLTLFLGIVAVMIIGIVVIGRAALHELEVSRMKSEFVSSVSHELKTPLALIRMFGETLESGLVHDETKRKEFYHIITKESERLTHLINNVLDFSKMETGNKQYRFEKEDIVHVVRSTLEAYRFHIRDLGFEMVIDMPDEPIDMMIDKDAISQALLNLLNNAAKYSGEQKYVRVEIAKQAESILISVEDHGVGIPREELGKIFEKFYRGSTARTKETAGSGLGLTLVRHIVEAHGGSVEITSTVGTGSIFILRLPLRQTVDS